MKLAIEIGLLFTILSYGYSKPFPQSLELSTKRSKTSFNDLSQACETLSPVHGLHQPQTGPFPYVITTNTDSVEPLGKIEVRIAGKNDEKFKGFMVQARIGDKIVNGKFESSDNVGLIDCFDGKENTASNKVHPDRVDKDEIKLTWVAPKDLQEDFKFVVTVVKDFKTFWVRQTSDTIKVKKQ
ncbi:putative defense protein 3 [Lycorma delicatula]|uniref:putative defense protein 3 n=1 Tax=Lycorma delicatula TaxID=130591 RepID=UPI003F51771A